MRLRKLSVLSTAERVPAGSPGGQVPFPLPLPPFSLLPSSFPLPGLSPCLPQAQTYAEKVARPVVVGASFPKGAL